MTENEFILVDRIQNPEADREESKAYCAECDHIEMCSWYPHDGCEWLKTDRYIGLKKSKSKEDNNT